MDINMAKRAVSSCKPHMVSYLSLLQGKQKVSHAIALGGFIPAIMFIC